MSFWAAGAAVVGALGAGKMSADASKDAAKSGQKGQERAAQVTAEAADRARRDVNRLFPSAQQDLLAGYSGAFDLVGQGIPEQQRLVSQGNLNAQQTTGQGFDQVRAALMGLPVDTANFAPRGVQMSQPIQNPMAGMFGNIGQQQQTRQADALSGIQSNRDLMTAVGGEELGLQNIDNSFWAAVAEGRRGGRTKWGDVGNTFMDSRSMLDATTPEQRQAIVDNSGFKREERQKLAALLNQYHNLGGQ